MSANPKAHDEDDIDLVELIEDPICRQQLVVDSTFKPGVASDHIFFLGSVVIVICASFVAVVCKDAMSFWGALSFVVLVRVGRFVNNNNQRIVNAPSSDRQKQ